MGGSAYRKIGLALTVLVLIGATPVSAQKAYFDPSISLYWNYDSNVRVLDSAGASGSSASDQSTSIDVLLPVHWATRSGSFDVSYEARYYKYDRTQAYDNLAHSLNVGLTRDFRRGGSLKFGAYYALSQDQSVPPQIQDQELFLTARTERRLYGGSIRYDKTTERNSWRFGLQGDWSQYPPITGTIPEQPPPDPNNLSLVPVGRFFGQVDFEYHHAVNRRFSIGPRYGLLYTDLDRGGHELVHLLGIYTGWVFSKYFSIGLTVGGSRREHEADSVAGVETVQVYGWFWTADIKIDPPIAAIEKGKLRLGLSIGIQPSGGGALAGTSTNSFVWIYLGSGSTRSPWSWTVGARYTSRGSNIVVQPDYETVGLGAGIERILAGRLSLSLNTAVSKQINASSQSTDAYFTNVGLGLVFYPKGRAAPRGP